MKSRFYYPHDWNKMLEEKFPETYDAYCDFYECYYVDTEVDFILEEKCPIFVKGFILLISDFRIDVTDNKAIYWTMEE